MSVKSFTDEKLPASAQPSDVELAIGPKVEIYDAEAEDEVFAPKGEHDVDYRQTGWIQAVVILLKSQIGLGTLALPSALHTLGAVPGTIIILGLGAIITYSNYVLGKFRENHPSCHSVGDVGEIMFGCIGREVLGAAYWLFMTMIAGAGLLAASISLNTLSENGACTVVFVIVATIVTALCASVRTFKQISWIGWVGLVSIVPAVLIVTIACGVASRPPAAPEGPYDTQIRATSNPTFPEAFLAIVNILFAFAGTPAFFSVIAEMKNPKDYNKSMFTMQALCTGFYTAIALALYLTVGQYIASPALGSAGPLIKKIGYGIALPGLFVGAIIYTHLAAKYIFVRLLRGKRHLTEPTPVHWVTWVVSVVGCAVFSFVVAEVIPFFGSLLGLVGALFGSLFCLSLCGAMWIYDNHAKYKRGATTFRFKLTYLWNILLIVLGFFMLVAGTYASADSIKTSFDKGEIGSPFSCADNSN